MRWVSVFFAFFLVGCGTLGPAAVERDRITLGEAYATSEKTQALQNIVRLRYGEFPVLLELGSIVMGYSLDGGLSIGGSGRFPLSDFSFSGSASTRLQERPTLTFSPVRGEELGRRLFRPIPVAAVTALIDQGVPAARVLQSLVKSVSGLRNARGIIGQPRLAADPGFDRLVALTSQLQLARALEVVSIEGSEEEADRMRLGVRVEGADANQDRVLELADLFGLSPEEIVRRPGRGGRSLITSELDVSMRSPIEVLIDLASEVAVPEPHRSELGVLDGSAPLASSPLIRTARSDPGSVHAKFQFRGWWFFVPHDDLAAKGALALVNLVLTLGASDAIAPAPVLTLQAQ